VKESQRNSHKPTTVTRHKTTIGQCFYLSKCMPRRSAPYPQEREETDMDFPFPGFDHQLSRA
jgi:hypothetical protein